MYSSKCLNTHAPAATPAEVNPIAFITAIPIEGRIMVLPTVKSAPAASRASCSALRPIWFKRTRAPNRASWVGSIPVERWSSEDIAIARMGRGFWFEMWW